MNQYDKKKRRLNCYALGQEKVQLLLFLETPIARKVGFSFEEGRMQGESLTIYTIHPGGNFRCKYSVLQLFQTQNGKIRKCISINWKVQKEKKKCIESIAYNF